jgi:hypothetical protein
MFSEIRSKSCTYGCGVEIYWNAEEITYYKVFKEKTYLSKYSNIYLQLFLQIQHQSQLTTIKNFQIQMKQQQE